MSAAGPRPTNADCPLLAVERPSRGAEEGARGENDRREKPRRPAEIYPYGAALGTAAALEADQIGEKEGQNGEEDEGEPGRELVQPEEPVAPPAWPRVHLTERREG